MSKVHANKGVERNKKPLKNIMYKIKITQSAPSSKPGEDVSHMRFKEEGYLILYWKYQTKPGHYSDIDYLHGFISPADLKEKIGNKQWGKFCQGKREFIIQRRVDGKNVSKKD